MGFETLHEGPTSIALAWNREDAAGVSAGDTKPGRAVRRESTVVVSVDRTPSC
jgi:hypothetical protein